MKGRAIRAQPAPLGLALRATLAVVSWALVLIASTGVEPAHGRTLEFLGASTTAQPVARFISRDAPSAFAYEFLSLLEISLVPNGTSQWTTLVSEQQAQRYQRGGLFDLHRANLEKKSAEAHDESALLGFRRAEEVSCLLVQVEAKSPPVHLEPGGHGHGYAWTCVLSSGGTPAARLLLEVQRDATMIHFAPDTRRPVIRVAKIPHFWVELSFRGKRGLPVTTLSRAYRVPQENTENFIYLLVFARSLPLIADLAPQEIIVMVHPDALHRPDGGLVTAHESNPTETRRQIHLLSFGPKG